MVVTIPIKTLNEAVNLVLTLDLDNGDMIRGTLVEVDDSMNVVLDNVLLTARNGEQKSKKSVFIRGSRINFFVLPPALKFAPFLQETGSPV